ncbi:uncharacterized protein TNCV_2028051 [Trichonephila clavipes]|nr:uncharacterized protein TNCV_2028051 [Trichonephila clavipes]
MNTGCTTTQILGNFNSGLDHLQLQYLPPHGTALSRLDTLCCPERDRPTNLEQPTLNHVQSDRMASTVLADPTRALQATNRGSGVAMEESENDVERLEQLSLYTDEHYLAGKLPLGDHLEKVLHGVEEYHQRCLHTRTRLSSVPKTNQDSSLNTTFCQYVTFHIDLAWHHCRRSCRCSGVKGSAQKGRLDLRFASARCLEIPCGTVATPTSARIVERVTMEPTSACRTILRSSLLVLFLVATDPVFRAWVPTRVHCFQQFQTLYSERSTCPATRCVDQPAVFIPMIRPLSDSLNCEKCLLPRLPGMFRLPKSSYYRRYFFILRLDKVDSAFHPNSSGSINEYQACLGTLTLGVSLQTDHQIETSAHASQRTMVTYTGMNTVDPGPHGLLRH